MRRPNFPLGLVRVLQLASALSIVGMAHDRAWADYSLFGAKGVNLQGATVNGGTTGSNDDVVAGSFSKFTALAGGGELNAQGPTVAGDVTFNGNVALGGATVGGAINSGKDVSVGSSGVTQSITAGGDVNFSGNTVNGNITAGNDFNLGTFANINGNVGANNNVTINGSTIHGNLTYGNSLIFGPFGGTITGTQTIAPVVAHPTPYIPYTLPNATQFTSGGANITSGGSQTNPLAPGSYGDVHLANFNDLYLRPGSYYFSSLEILNDQTIHLVGLTSQNSIAIYVTGNITEGALSSTTINGQSFSSADLSLAKNVLFETHGNFIQDSLGADQIFGTIFAPDGNVQFGQYSQVNGSVLASGLVTSSVGLVVNFQSSNLIPEPSAILMTGIGLLIAGGYARRRKLAR